MTLRVTHDPKRGLAYIYLKGDCERGECVRQVMVEVDPDIVLDFDKNGYLIGIELLRSDLLHPALASIAIPPDKEQR